jgi:hypothetical protein
MDHVNTGINSFSGYPSNVCHKTSFGIRCSEKKTIIFILNFKYTAVQGTCRYNPNKNLGITVSNLRQVSYQSTPNEAAILQVKLLINV